MIEEQYLKDQLYENKQQRLAEEHKKSMDNLRHETVVSELWKQCAILEKRLNEIKTSNK